MNPIERAAAHCAWAAVPVPEKLLLFGGLLLLAILLPAWPTAPVILAIVLAAVLWARVRMLVFFGALVGPVIFILIGSVPVALDVVGGFRHGVWFPESGIARATATALRATAASAATIGLACTTTMASLLAAARRAGVPAPLCHITDMIYRLVGILIVTARALGQAIALRLGFTNRRRALAALGGQFAAIFVHALGRSRRMHEAMSLRAAPGSWRVVGRAPAVSMTHIVAICAVLLGVCLLGVVS